MKPIRKAVATVGKYTDGNGQEKTRYHRLGTVFERPDGSQAIKIDSMPIGNEWNGWVNFYPLDDQNQNQGQGQQQPGYGQPQNNQAAQDYQNATGGGGFQPRPADAPADDTIPF